MVKVLLGVLAVVVVVSVLPRGSSSAQSWTDYHSASGFTAQRVNVRYDTPGATHIILDVVRLDDRTLEVVNWRQGSSGVSFARRLVHCQDWTFKYLGEGEIIEAMNNPPFVPDEMTELTEGSISTVIAVNACQIAGLS